jgi:mediator of RNA polymerase II transcription subunit 13
MCSLKTWWNSNQVLLFFLFCSEAMSAEFCRSSERKRFVAGNDDSSEAEAPAVVIYMVDPFCNGSEDNSELLRMSCLGLLRSFTQMLPHMTDLLRQNVFLQIVSVQSLFELSQSKRNSRMPSVLRGLAFSVYSQAQRPLRYLRDCKTLTGFGSASLSEKYLKMNEAKAKHVSQLHCPPFVLSPLPIKKKSAAETDGLSDRGASVLFCNYFLSEDQHWLLASCSDDRGELLKTVTINIEIPNKRRRKRASARRIGLRKLMDWLLGVMATALVPWRLVIGRIGRIGHGELRGENLFFQFTHLKHRIT